MAADRTIVTADGAPVALGAYSHAVASNGLLFCAGQLALDPTSRELIGATPAEQIEVALRNVEAVCRAAGARLADAVKVTVYLVDIGAFEEINAVYETFFTGGEPPARVVLAVAALPKGALVEIDAVVALP